MKIDHDIFISKENKDSKEERTAETRNTSNSGHRATKEGQGTSKRRTEESANSS